MKTPDKIEKDWRKELVREVMVFAKAVIQTTDLPETKTESLASIIDTFSKKVEAQAYEKGRQVERNRVLEIMDSVVDDLEAGVKLYHSLSGIGTSTERELCRELAHRDERMLEKLQALKDKQEELKK